MNDKFKNLFLWLFIVVILVSAFGNFSSRHSAKNKLTYTEFLQRVNQKEIMAVTIADRVIQGVSRDGHNFVTYLPMQDQFLLSELIKKGIDVKGTPPHEQSLLLRIFISWFPMLLLIAIWILFMRNMQGGGRGGPMSFGRSKARLLGEDQIKTTFKDVEGIEEAREDMYELVEFLKDPQKFQRLGGKIPRGVLLVGPPGTGKTLLAKAVAGEAEVPFFSISGSDFVEMFVGVGASRVRDMFDQAKKRAPCIIFIDEIDAVGRHRGAGLGGGHDEREQTLNQLLVELDGFEGSEGVIVLAATNRPDVLDHALLRPGRFDRQIAVSLPDIKGRDGILKVHMKKVTLDSDIDSLVIARGTPGFSGADLANLVNEATLIAARNNNKAVTMEDFEKAKDKIIMGGEMHSRVMSEDDKELTSYHEAGHAVVSFSMNEHDPVHKVSIIARAGGALGATFFLPEKDRYTNTLQWIEDCIATLFGGRIAEELIFGSKKITTGAANDIEKATDLARKMVTIFGFSKKLGPILYAANENEVFLGHSVAKTKHISEETAKLIDNEIRKIIDHNYIRAKKILVDNEDKLHEMAALLIEKETINYEDVKKIMGELSPKKATPKKRAAGSSSKKVKSDSSASEDK